MMRVFACLVVLASMSAPAPARQDELEPSAGLFSSITAPEPYYLTVREALVGEHPYRKCQMVVLPSFDREWVVYMVREDGGSPTLLYKRLKKQLWTEIFAIISENGRKKSFSLGSESQQAALARITADTERFTAVITATTADVLEEVWWRMLDRARHSADEDGVRFDGTRYFVAHWRTDVGYRGAETWSPEEGSRTSGFVKLAEEMAALAQAFSPEREKALASNATALLTHLEAP